MVAASTLKTFAADATLDRVVASIGYLAITASDVETEYRFERFIEGKSPEVIPDAAAFDSARDRLVNQQQLRQEAEGENIERADLPRQAVETLNEVRRKYSTEEQYQSALRARGLTEQQILNRLEDQLLTMRLIDQRLRPAAWVDQSEIETYYAHTFVPDFGKRSTGAVPALDEVQSQIREILVQKKVDELLDAWLDELKSGRHVRIHSF